MLTPTSSSERQHASRGLVSVIIPSYNRSDLLPQAIASCAAQTWPNIEILIVDDDSEEDLEAVVAAARERHGLDDRLKYFKQLKGGGPAARNLGFRHASGEFVQYLDSDDLLHPEKLARQMERLLAKPHLDMVFCVDEQFERIPGDIRLLWNVPRRYDSSDDLERFLQEDTVWAPASPLWRRSTIDRVAAWSLEPAGGWNEALTCWQDWQFGLAALCAGIQYECVPEVLNYVRRHRGVRVSRNRGLAEERSCLFAAKLAISYLSRAGLWDEQRQILIAQYMVRHLIAVELMGGSGSAALRREMLLFLEGLAWTRRHKTLFRLYRAIAGTWFYRKSLAVGLFLPIYPPAMRNRVQAVFLPEPPDAVRRLVDATMGDGAPGVKATEMIDAKPGADAAHDEVLARHA
jgi:glycosyltransferase involved in cell wall biosynthesis